MGGAKTMNRPLQLSKVAKNLIIKKKSFKLVLNRLDSKVTQKYQQKSKLQMHIEAVHDKRDEGENNSLVNFNPKRAKKRTWFSRRRIAQISSTASQKEISPLEMRRTQPSMSMFTISSPPFGSLYPFHSTPS